LWRALNGGIPRCRLKPGERSERGGKSKKGLYLCFDILVSFKLACKKKRNSEKLHGREEKNCAHGVGETREECKRMRGRKTTR